jgi:accessory gene regulator protein AgrB
MKNRSLTTDVVVISILVVLAVASRLLPHAPGFVAVTGASMFAGWYLRRGSLAYLIPLIVLSLSDLMLGFYQPLLMLAVYLVAIAPVLAGRLLRGNATPLRLAASALCCSVLSLLTINFFVWVSSAWYAKTAAGLLQCYVAALPFFKYRLAGDVCSVAVCFGVYAIVAHCWPSLAIEPLRRTRSWSSELLAPWRKSQQL